MDLDICLAHYVGRDPPDWRCRAQMGNRSAAVRKIGYTAGTIPMVDVEVCR